MATFKRGLDAEDRVRTRLESYGCKLQANEKLDHKQKLDFVLTQFPDNPNFYACGVQITTKCDDGEKQREFLQVNWNSRVTRKSVYIELDDKVDLDDGGTLTVFTAIAQFVLDRRFEEQKIGAVRIYEDLSYGFFDLAERVQQLKSKTAQPSAPSPPAARAAVAAPAPSSPAIPVDGAVSKLRHAWSGEPGLAIIGYINAYYRSGGHGFITAQDGRTYFFHITNVVDDSLRELINNLPFSDHPVPVDATVAFTSAGFTKAGAKYEQAANLRLHRAT